MPWPGSFGDIMPIEEVWNDICTELNDEEVNVHTTTALYEEVKATFDNLFDTDYKARLIGKLKSKLQLVVASHGGWI